MLAQILILTKINDLKDKDKMDFRKKIKTEMYLNLN